jgi:hypothetical protein
MQNSDGRFELMGAGSDGKIYKLAEQVDRRWEKYWSAIGTANGENLTHSVSVAGNTNDGQLQVFATDEKGMVYSNWQETPGGRWQSRWSAVDARKGMAFGR